MMVMAPMAMASVHTPLAHDDDELFAEVLQLLTEPTETQVLDLLPHQRVKSVNGSVARRKRAIDCLREEEAQLTLRLQRLREAQRGHASSADAMEMALAERYKRRQAERERRQLRDAVYQQTKFLRGLKSVISCQLRVPLCLNLRRHLHNYTRLPADRTARWHEYNEMSRDERLDAAMELLCNETDGVPMSDSYLETEYFEESDDVCAITTKSVFVMDECDVPSALRAVCVAVSEIVVQCRNYKCVNVSRELVDADALSQRNIQYRITGVRRKSPVDCRDISVESRAVTIYKLTDRFAVVLWDFVDCDEQHQTTFNPDISRQCIGVCLVRLEMCPDGVERIVYRELSTRYYTYRGGEPTPPERVQRYISSMRLNMRSNELLFRDILAKQIAEERAAYANVVECNE